MLEKECDNILEIFIKKPEGIVNSFLDLQVTYKITFGISLSQKDIGACIAILLSENFIFNANQRDERYVLTYHGLAFFHTDSFKKRLNRRKWEHGSNRRTFYFALAGVILSVTSLMVTIIDSCNERNSTNNHRCNTHVISDTVKTIILR